VVVLLTTATTQITCQSWSVPVIKSQIPIRGCLVLVNCTLLSGRARCDRCGTLLCNTDCVRQCPMCALLRGTATVPYALLPCHHYHRPRARLLRPGDCKNWTIFFLTDGWSLSASPGCAQGTRTRWCLIFILLRAWSGESSGELENLGETWWKPWLSVTIKLFRSWLSSLLINRLFPLNSLPWLSRISDTLENKPESLDSDNQINISILISFLRGRVHKESLDHHSTVRNILYGLVTSWNGSRVVSR
jgi:hypothetical protein